MTWTYDKSYQLTNDRRSGANSYNVTCLYDPLGNRSVQINGGSRTTYVYDAMNQLLTSQSASGTTTNTWDANGSILNSTTPSNQRTTYTWNFENRLAKTVYLHQLAPFFTTVSDPAFRAPIRPARQIPSGSGVYVAGNRRYWGCRSSFTSMPSRFGELVSQWRSGIGSYYLFDAQGSTSQLTNGSGSQTDNYIYDAWGNVVVSNGATINNYLYVGALGICSTRIWVSISYGHVTSPQYAGFISVDPLIALLREVLSEQPEFAIPSAQVVRQALQLYQYAINNPVNHLDPSGMAVPIVIGGGAGLAGAALSESLIAALAALLGITAAVLAALAIALLIAFLIQRFGRRVALCDFYRDGCLLQVIQWAIQCATIEDGICQLHCLPDTGIFNGIPYIQSITNAPAQTCTSFQNWVNCILTGTLAEPGLRPLKCPPAERNGVDVTEDHAGLNYPGKLRS